MLNANQAPFEVREIDPISALHAQAAHEHQSAAEFHLRAAESHSEKNTKDANAFSVSAMNSSNTAHKNSITAFTATRK